MTHCDPITDIQNDNELPSYLQHSPTAHSWPLHWHSTSSGRYHVSKIAMPYGPEYETKEVHLQYVRNDGKPFTDLKK